MYPDFDTRLEHQTKWTDRGMSLNKMKNYIKNEVVELQCNPNYVVSTGDKTLVKH